MNKTVIVTVALLGTGIALGAGVQTLLRDDAPASPPEAAVSAPPAATAAPLAAAPVAVSRDNAQDLLQQEIAARTKLEQTVARLEKELGEVKTQLSGRESPRAAAAPASAAVADVPQHTNPEVNDQALRDAGLNQTQVAQIKDRFEQLEMDKLFLRDRAQREGWIGTVRYSNEVAKLEESRQGIRNSMDEPTYDAYLYATGQSNRVVIQEMLQGSPAKQSGIEPGDIVLRYGDKRVYTTRELQNATAGGQPGEMVRVELVRNGQRVDVYVPRGPLGVYLDTDSVKP